MDALHRGDHAELAEARNVGGAQVLRVLHAPAQILLLRVRLERLLEDVQRLAIGAVADGVHAQLESVRDGEFGGLANVGRIVGIQARCVGLVGVRFQQPRAARTERAIDLPLDRAHGEEIDRPHR